MPVLCASGLHTDPDGTAFLADVLGLEHGPNLQVLKSHQLRGNSPSQGTGGVDTLVQLGSTDHPRSSEHRARARADDGSKHDREAA